MTFNEYQKKAKETAIYPGKGENVEYALIGLTGEVGEIANKVQKILREKRQVRYVIGDEQKDLLKEAGDCLWFLSTLISELGGSFEEVAKSNLEKLADRRARGVICGSGDDR